MVALIGSHFILGGLNYYVLTFKLIIWYNALIVYCNGMNRGSVQIHMQSYLLKDVVKTGRVETLANRYGVGNTKSNPRTDMISLRRTISNRARQREIIQVHSNSPGRGKQSPNGKTKG